MSKVGLVIPILNNFDQAIELIYSAKTQENELKVYIQPQHRYQVPLSAAWNKGMKEALRDGCDYIIIVVFEYFANYLPVNFFCSFIFPLYQSIVM